MEVDYSGLRNDSPHIQGTVTTRNKISKEVFKSSKQHLPQGKQYHLLLDPRWNNIVRMIFGVEGITFTCKNHKTSSAQLHQSIFE